MIRKAWFYVLAAIYRGLKKAEVFLEVYVAHKEIEQYEKEEGEN